MTRLSLVIAAILGLAAVTPSPHHGGGTAAAGAGGGKARAVGTVDASLTWAAAR